jgi:N-acetylmuramoyl-L-alanine amidase
MARKLHAFVWIVVQLLFAVSLLGNSGMDPGLPSEDPRFHQVQAQKGDGIFALLRRYKLDGNYCNFEKFLELNAVERDHALQLDRDYFIPVMIYDYNGTSIRSTIGDPDMNKALRIKAYNEYLQAQELRQSSYIESRILWVPFHELNCGSALQQTPGQEEEGFTGKLNRYEPLFGPNYSSVPIEDESLKGKVFYVVSGHGGPDPGAQCTECEVTLCEDEYAYDVSLRLARNLMQHGATVHILIQDKNDGIRDGQYLACDTDERSINNKEIPLNQKLRLKQRTDDINRLFAMHKSKGATDQVVISIHVDSRSQSKRQDVFFYHAKGSKSGEKIARTLHSTFDKKYNTFQKGRGYKGYVRERNLYVLRNTHPAAVFVELANIRNKYDHRRLLLESNRQALANWLFEGLVDAVE